MSSLELTVDCSPTTSFMKEALGITSTYVSEDRLVMRVDVAEQYGDILIVSATGSVLGRMENANLQETISMPVVSGTGLMIINLVTDKGVYNQKLFVR